MLKKLLITPWSGSFPDWFNETLKEMIGLEKYGYDWLITSDMKDFYQRAEDKLGITPNIVPGGSRLHNYRSAYGLLYEEELKGYDYWGITDLDCVYGRINKFMPDEKLEKLDIWSNHHSYICGPWTMFKNTEKVNNLFKQVPDWQTHMTSTNSHPGRWTEEEYSRAVEKSGLSYLYTFFQGHDPSITTNLRKVKGKLFDGDDEIMMFHFNRSKRWPL